MEKNSVTEEIPGTENNSIRQEISNKENNAMSQDIPGMGDNPRVLVSFFYKEQLNESGNTQYREQLNKGQEIAATKRTTKQLRKYLVQRKIP